MLIRFSSKCMCFFTCSHACVGWMSSHIMRLSDKTRSRIKSGRMQCSACAVRGTSSCEATEGLLLFAKMSPSAMIAPAAVTSTLARGPSLIL